MCDCREKNWQEKNSETPLDPNTHDYPALSFQKTHCWSFRHMFDDIIYGGMQIFD